MRESFEATSTGVKGRKLLEHSLTSVTRLRSCSTFSRDAGFSATLAAVTPGLPSSWHLYLIRLGLGLGSES